MHGRINLRDFRHKHVFSKNLLLFLVCGIREGMLRSLTSELSQAGQNTAMLQWSYSPLTVSLIPPF